MKNDLTKAMETLNNGNYTCVLCKENVQYKSTKRGVKPLIEWIDGKTNLKGFAAADKIVGKAAALLYVLLGVKGVYAHVISESAIQTLEENGIPSQWDVSVKRIINRAGTGSCPMEEAVRNTDVPEEALKLIKRRLSELNGK